MQREAFIWDGIEHWTGGDLMETVALLSDEDEATDFMQAYVESCGGDRESCESNIAYICGIIEDGDETLELFGIEKPVDVISPRNWWPASSVGVKVEA